MEKSGLSELYTSYRKSTSISTDSREIIPGCIFFALKGERFNGNLFALNALEKGASFAVVDEEPETPDSRILLVDDTLKALQDLALLHRQKNPIPLIAITGTNGKTTTKELIAAVLSKKFNALCTEGNLNNHIGVPLTLLKVRNDTEIAVIEMGANHIGEIRELCRIALPNFGIITNIGRAHLDGFGGYQGVIRAKTEMYEHIRKNDGTLFVNADDPLLMEHSSGASRITYGKSEEADCTGIPLHDEAFAGVMIKSASGENRITSNLFGAYNFPNILAAVAIGMHFRIGFSDISSAIEEYQPRNNRSQLKKTGRNTVILDAYNANPDSMSAAIHNMAARSKENGMLILGDMLELGAESEQEHKKIIELIGQLGFTNVILTGPVFSSVYAGALFKTFRTSADALEYLQKNPPEGQFILIKGSRGIKMEVVTEAL